MYEGMWQPNDNDSIQYPTRQTHFAVLEVAQDRCLVILGDLSVVGDASLSTFIYKIPLVLHICLGVGSWVTLSQ